MPTPQVRDIRGLYIHDGVGGTADQVVAPLPWQKISYVGTSIAAPGAIVSGPGVLGGITVDARGAASVNVDVYDAASPADVKDANLADAVTTGTYDGFKDTPIVMTRGIRVVIAGAGANTRVIINYR